MFFRELTVWRHVQAFRIYWCRVVWESWNFLRDPLIACNCVEAVVSARHGTCHYFLPRVIVVMLLGVFIRLKAACISYLLRHSWRMEQFPSSGATQSRWFVYCRSKTAFPYVPVTCCTSARVIDTSRLLSLFRMPLHFVGEHSIFIHLCKTCSEVVKWSVNNE
jgi:hypothetical protein